MGQLILDPNGEYANENVQDSGSLRSVWCFTANAAEEDVVTYGLHRHPRDPKRRIIKLNFLGSDPSNWADRDAVRDALWPLIQGKEIIDAALAREDARYIRAFRNVSFEIPEDWDRSAQTRFRRVIMAYRAILIGAGFEPPRTMRRARLDGLTNEQLRTALKGSAEYQRAGILFERPEVSWDDAREAFSLLGAAINDPKKSGYDTFNTNYRNKKENEGRDWHDNRLTGILALLEHRGGLRLVGQLASQHSPDTTRDYADLIVDDLHAGRLVIVDQSTGDPEMNEAAAERLMWRIFDAQRAAFVNPRLDEEERLIPPPDVLVYIEEAHNLLPASESDLKNVWSRTAKEGSKYRIGLVYATQEPSSIQPNILKNTDNWFVAHLNNATAMVNEPSTDFTRNDGACYPRLGDMLNVLDHLATYLYRDGFMPLVRAHAHAAIPLRQGSDIIRALFENGVGAKA